MKEKRTIPRISKARVFKRQGESQKSIATRSERLEKEWYPSISPEEASKDSYQVERYDL